MATVTISFALCSITIKLQPQETIRTAPVFRLHPTFGNRYLLLKCSRPLAFLTPQPLAFCSCLVGQPLPSPLQAPSHLHSQLDHADHISLSSHLSAPSDRHTNPCHSFNSTWKQMTLSCVLQPWLPLLAPAPKSSCLPGIAPHPSPHTHTHILETSKAPLIQQVQNPMVFPKTWSSSSMLCNSEWHHNPSDLRFPPLPSHMEFVTMPS